MAPPLVLDDRYQLDDRVAVGGMGEVWRATDQVLGRPVAVKLLRPAYAQDEAGLARFRAEARYAARLSHPNIAHVYDYWGGDPPGQPYLVMELVDGPSLAGLLADGPLSPERTLEIISQAAAGLQAAHVAGVVHRDIKPGNLLIGAGGLVKIADFGIAHAVGSAPVTRTGEVIGTPAYLSPEQAIGRSATPASDLYALGIVAYQCLAGEPPFTGEPLAVALAHQEQALPTLPASVPPRVAALVGHLAAKDPRERPPSAGAVARRAERLRAAATGDPVTLPGLPAFTAAAAPPTMQDFPALAGKPARDHAGSAAGDGGPGLFANPAGSAGAPAPPAGDMAPGNPAAGDAAAAGTAAAGNAAADGTAAGGAAAGETAAATSAAAAAGRPVHAAAAAGAGEPGMALPAAGAPGGGAGRAAPAGLAGRVGQIFSGRMPMRTGLAAVGVVVFGLAGWALSSLPGQAPGHQHRPPVPALRPSGPATGAGVIPTGSPNPYAVETPRTRRSAARPRHSASPSATASASPSASVTPTPTAGPSGSPTASASPSASQSPSPPPSGTATATPSAP